MKWKNKENFILANILSLQTKKKCHEGNNGYVSKTVSGIYIQIRDDGHCSIQKRVCFILKVNRSAETCGKLMKACKCVV
jgi:hypothetical protein